MSASFQPQRRSGTARARHFVIALAGSALLVLPFVGCQEYDVPGSRVFGPAEKDMADISDATRPKTKSGVRSGLSETAQDIERSVGY